MLERETERRVDEMIAIAEELGGIVPIHGWTKYAMKILTKLQDLSDGLCEQHTARYDIPEEPEEEGPHRISADDLKAMVMRRRAEIRKKTTS